MKGTEKKHTEGLSKFHSNIYSILFGFDPWFNLRTKKKPEPRAKKRSFIKPRQHSFLKVKQVLIQKQVEQKVVLK